MDYIVRRYCPPTSSRADGEMYIDEDPKEAEEITAYAVAVRNRNQEARFLVRGDQSAESMRDR
jgi:hypothetical protein